MNTLRDQAMQLFNAAIAAADPGHAVKRHLSGHLPLPDPGGRLEIIALGKAASAMMAATIPMIPGSVTWHGLIVTNAGNQTDLAGCETIIGGHPLPDHGSLTAGSAILDLAAPLGPADRVLALISGGGSALAVAPVAGVSLSDKIEMNRLLLAHGFDITRTNEVRQSLSRLKGGGLTRAAAPAPVTALILSDVIGDDLRAVASGPTVAPIGNRATAAALLRDRGIWDHLPDSITNVLSGDDANDDTPSATNILIGSNAYSVEAAVHASAGQIKRLADPVTGDVGEAAELLLNATGDSFLAGGETTVVVSGTGKGGRNQELALRFAMGARDIGDGWVFLSGGTDGRDGPTDAAGAIVDPGTVQRILDAGLDPGALISNNDAYPALDAAGDLIRIPATGTNVADIQVFLRA